MRSVKNFYRALTGLLTVAFGVAIYLVVGFSPAQSVAQENERTYIQVRSSTVKGGMLDEYVALQKQLTEAMKADGQSGRTIWQEIRGDLRTFHSVSSLDNFAANDEPFDPPMDEDAWEEWVDRITSTTHSNTRMVLRTHPEYATASGDGRERNLLYLRYRTVGPGRMDDYHDWIENSLSPALKEGGADVNFSHIVLGGNNRTFISATYLDNWAQMDGPGPLAHMSEAEIDALLDPAGQMVTESENRLLRYRDDLSF
jgi:hypothetical protein